MTKLDPLDNAPLAERARAAILEAILSGRFVDRLPSEDELARMLDVSRTTIRAALQSLEQGGVVTRRRAVGTLIHKNVSPARLALQRMIGYDRLLEESGGRVKIEIAWALSDPPVEFVTGFELEPDEEHLVTEKSYSTDDTVAIFIRDAVPGSAIATEPGKRIPASLFEFSQRYMREPIDHAVAEIVPMCVAQGTETRLALKPGQPFMRLLQRSYTRNGDQVAWSITDVNDQFVRFEVFRR